MDVCRCRATGALEVEMDGKKFPIYPKKHVLDAAYFKWENAGCPKEKRRELEFYFKALKFYQDLGAKIMPDKVFNHLINLDDNVKLFEGETKKLISCL